jgi:hypothetical protein
MSVRRAAAFQEWPGSAEAVEQRLLHGSIIRAHATDRPDQRTNSSVSNLDANRPLEVGTRLL